MAGPRQSGFQVDIYLSVALYCGLNQSESKEDEKAEDEPDVQHLGAGGGAAPLSRW